jgi:hypothetical protein
LVATAVLGIHPHHRVSQVLEYFGSSAGILPVGRYCNLSDRQDAGPTEYCMSESGEVQVRRMPVNPAPRGMNRIIRGIPCEY